MASSFAHMMRRMHAPVELLLREPAIGAGDHVLAPHTRPRNAGCRSATSSGCSTTFVPWLITPGARILPSGSFTSFHTPPFVFVAWIRGFDQIGAGAHFQNQIDDLASGTSVVCGPGQLPQQTW